MKVCTIDGCDGAARARGWCHKHWQRWRRTGDPTRLLGRDNIVRHDQARHGSRRRYELGCRCFDCRIEDNRYQRRWRDGGRARVPAAEVVGHLNLLVESGWTKAQIRREAGLGNSTLWHIMAGKVAAVNSRTATAVLDLEPYSTSPARPVLEVVGPTCEDCGAEPLGGGRWCWPCFKRNTERGQVAS